MNVHPLSWKKKLLNTTLLTCMKRTYYFKKKSIRPANRNISDICICFEKRLCYIDS